MKHIKKKWSIREGHDKSKDDNSDCYQGDLTCIQ